MISGIQNSGLVHLNPHRDKIVFIHTPRTFFYLSKCVSEVCYQNAMVTLQKAEPKGEVKAPVSMQQCVCVCVYQREREKGEGEVHLRD